MTLNIYIGKYSSNWVYWRMSIYEYNRGWFKWKIYIPSHSCSRIVYLETCLYKSWKKANLLAVAFNLFCFYFALTHYIILKFMLDYDTLLFNCLLLGLKSKMFLKYFMYLGYQWDLKCYIHRWKNLLMHSTAECVLRRGTWLGVVHLEHDGTGVIF